MSDFFIKNLGWLVTLVFTFIGYVVFFIRQSDKTDRNEKDIALLRSRIHDTNDSVQKLIFNMEANKERLEKLEAMNDRMMNTLNDLSSDVKVIASWVKLQSGETLIEVRRDK